MQPYPLTFEPLYQPRIWGGQKLALVLGRSLPPGAIGESWEIADLPGATSIVAHGPARGQSLYDLVRTWREDLYGAAALVDGRFPLLIKYLDAREALSIQVHPDEAAATRMGGDVRVKHEAWYAVNAEPGAFILRGVKAGVTPDEVRAGISSGKLAELMQRVAGRAGHAWYLPSGTAHALGGGMLVAEVQTPSDTTFRLYDWGRVDGVTGRARDLHVEEALASMAFGLRDYPEEEAQHLASVWTIVTRLIRCPSFAMDRVRMVEGVEQEIPAGGFMVWMIQEGRCEVCCDGHTGWRTFTRGETVLLPAGLVRGRVRTLEKCMWLEVSIPQPSSLAEFDRPARESLRDVPATPFVKLNVDGGR